jgi:mono/diheme cytochrome c family protein
MRYWILLLLIIALVACENDVVATPEIQDPTLDINQIPVLGEASPPPPVPFLATDPRFPIQPSGEGLVLYEQYCAACHGINGEGQPPDPLAFGAAPPHNADGHTWHHADQSNFLTVWQGAIHMPGFYDRLSPDEIVLILAYIKTWWHEDQLARQMELTQSIADQ